MTRRAVNQSLAVAACLLLGATEVIAVDVEVTFSVAAHDRAFSGRVYLFFGSGSAEPRQGPNWFHPEPIVAHDVVGLKPGEKLRLSTSTDDALTFPRNFSTVDLRGKRVQAVARFNPMEARVGTGQGNGYSDVITVPKDDATLALSIDHIVPERPFVETDWTKLLTVRSGLLSDFHGRDVHLRAAVTLPAGYDRHPERRYPAIFIVPGFGGTHQRPERFGGERTTLVHEHNEREVEYIRVTLDPSCPMGHHVFADSANNGQVGQALVTEFLPAFDRQFRSIPEAGARFLTGHSSGGWSALWLQVTYPDVFGGVWSTAPDPVDFRDFQRINLYRPGESMYVDQAGRRRPLARRGGQTAIWYEDFAWMEHVLGSGGQLHSFEAAFSPRGPDGTPRRLWDRETGVIDPEVAQAWRPYDIRLKLEQQGEVLGPQLRGKLHIFVGDEDTFLLEGAIRLLGKSLADGGSDAVVEIHPGKDHSTLMMPQLRDRIRREMTSKFLSSYPEWPVLVNRNGKRIMMWVKGVCQPVSPDSRLDTQSYRHFGPPHGLPRDSAQGTHSGRQCGSGANQAPNYDEFQDDQEVFDLIHARPDCVLRVTMAHCDVDRFEQRLSDGSPEALTKAAANFEELVASPLTRVVENLVWVYEIVSPKRPHVRQLGLGGFARTGDLRTEQNPGGVIVRNEGIRPQKAEGRAKLIQATNAYIGTVNCAVRDVHQRLITLLESHADAADPSYMAIDEAGNTHRVWIVTEPETISELQRALAEEPAAYVADGNHRSAAAAALRREHFLAVFFTTDRLRLEPYNRLVEDVGIPHENFLKQLECDFSIEPLGELPQFRPSRNHEIGLYTAGQWWRLSPKSHTFQAGNAAESIDADIIQRHLFDAILGITDARDQRLNFVGGNKDAAYLKRRVDAGEYAYAISLAPVTMDQFVAVCEQSRFMPPKSTWFDPKIRSGLVTALL